jgi:L-iditol 2-dehydrogenase
MIGLLAIQALRAAGCGRVIAVDVDRGRLELAAKLGAGDTLSPEDGDVAAEVVRRTAGRGADLAVEAVGLPATVSAAIHSVRKGGSVALVGNLSPKTELPLQAVVTRELTLYGSCASQGEYPECLELMVRGMIDVEPLLTAVAPLAEGARWFERLHQGDEGLMKVVLRP